MLHFTATGATLYIATRSPFNVFEAVRLPLRHVLPISAFFAGFVLLGNLCLTLNPVGFYQLAKIMTTPTVVLFNLILFRKTISAAMLLSIISVCVGVALTNTKLAMSNPRGAFVAVAAYTVTALYQIWIGKKIADLKVSAPQLLLNQAPVSVFILAFFVPFVDTIPDVGQIQTSVLWTLFWSGIVASVLNLSQFLIIGRTSALTFNIVSNLKTIIILALSWSHEQRIPTVQDAFGIVLAIGGAWAYAQLSQRA
jgi:solute carrier family 35 protein E3